jgi:hypothetical protein
VREPLQASNRLPIHHETHGRLKRT